jgi:hypothetical protein
MVVWTTNCVFRGLFLMGFFVTFSDFVSVQDRYGHTPHFRTQSLPWFWILGTFLFELPVIVESAFPSGEGKRCCVPWGILEKKKKKKKWPLSVADFSVGEARICDFFFFFGFGFGFFVLVFGFFASSSPPLLQSL